MQVPAIHMQSKLPRGQSTNKRAVQRAMLRIAIKNPLMNLQTTTQPEIARSPNVLTLPLTFLLEEGSGPRSLEGFFPTQHQTPAKNMDGGYKSMTPKWSGCIFIPKSTAMTPKKQKQTARISTERPHLGRSRRRCSGALRGRERDAKAAIMP